MYPKELLHNHFEEVCPEIHESRLQALIDVAAALQSSRSLKLTDIGRCLESDIDIKHRIKKVDRLESNQHLYGEMSRLYEGLSSYVFKYISQDKNIPIIVDLCYLKDDHDIQMLSAEIASQGRSIPIYRDVFGISELKGRGTLFLERLSKCLPRDKQVLIIMDAGFGDDWFEEIEKQGWYWLVRARKGKYIKLSEGEEWQNVGELFEHIGLRGKNYPHAMITKDQSRPCRIITKGKEAERRRKKPDKLPGHYHAGNGSYKRITQEPWVLATNLPEEYKVAQVINYYKKRMQIEESFRDVKSHQFGLGSRYIRTRCIYRWGVKMLLSALAQVMLWIIGVIGHSQGFQRVFQSNTVKDKKVFSYFYLGRLIVEYDKLKDLKIDYKNLPTIIDQELSRQW